MTPLEAEIRAIIEADGPMTFARYMELCLSHPQYGYYMTRDPFGVAGDFTTAPEISQMFGELIGAWAAAVWQQMGSPSSVKLIELGPGRGTLMADALRAAKALPDFRAALSVHLVEISPVLRARQQKTLAGAGVPVAWHRALEEIDDGPVIVIANEFVDALPIQQYASGNDGWHMLMVRIDGGRLNFTLAPDHAFRISANDPVGTIVEHRLDGPIRLLARRIARQGGAALIVDYGNAKTTYGNTLQAARRHQYAEVLEHPGEADITSLVDFEQLAGTVRREGAQVRGPVEQGEFLRRLGIEARAAKLKAKATSQQANDIDSALARLTAPDQMGALFKVLAIAHPKLGPLPGFDS